MITYEWVLEASQRIKGKLVVTPLTYDSELEIYLKWENQQVTGSFKARGALNKILALTDWERAQGLVTASAGNHGLGVALAAKETGAKALVFTSDHAVPLKLQKMRDLGAEIQLVKGGYTDAEAKAIQYANIHGMTWISPYNDGQVIAGQ